MIEIDNLKDLFYNKIIDFLYTQGLDIKINDLQQNIHISKNEIDSCINNTQIQSSINNTKSSNKIKFKPKPKPKHKPTPKPKQYHMFIQLCNTNKFTYFQFNDEFEWTGPAIKINDSNYSTQITPFNDADFKYTQIKGTGFKIIRPTNFEDDSYINYDLPSSIYSKSTITNTSDDEDIVDTIEWEFRNIKYLLDTQNNDVYAINTYDIIGKRIFSQEYDDYIIEFN